MTSRSSWVFKLPEETRERLFHNLRQLNLEGATRARLCYDYDISQRTLSRILGDPSRDPAKLRADWQKRKHKRNCKREYLLRTSRELARDEGVPYTVMHERLGLRPQLVRPRVLQRAGLPSDGSSPGDAGGIPDKGAPISVWLRQKIT